jgi:hypothetical protein
MIHLEGNICIISSLKLESLKNCLNKIFSRVLLDKLLCDMFPIKSILKQGHVLSPLLLNVVLHVEHVLGRVQVNQDGWKLSGT